MKNLDLYRIHQQVTVFLVEAGKIADQYFSGQTRTLYKNVKAGADLATTVLTKADKEVEEYLVARLEEFYPAIGYVGEESKRDRIKNYNWIIDPIDGTLNFIWGVPLFCHSIALWKENEPVYAAVYLPFSKQLVYAMQGRGFYLNGKKTKRAFSKSLPAHVLYALVGTSEEKSRVLSRVAAVTPSFRHYGSAVYHGVLTALGTVQASVYINTGFWDMAAIYLFAKETALACEFISPKPDIHDKALKAYKYSLIMGERKLVAEIKRELTRR